MKTISALILAGLLLSFSNDYFKMVRLTIRGKEGVTEQSLKNEILKQKGIINVTGGEYGTGYSINIIYDTKKVSDKSIVSLLEGKGFQVVNQVFVDLSHCKQNCKAKCCTHPEIPSGKCLCSKKGKDCETSCCGSQH